MPASKSSLICNSLAQSVSHSRRDQGCNYDVPDAIFIVALNMLGHRPFTRIPWTCWAADLLHGFHAGQLTVYTESVLGSWPFTRIPCWAGDLLHGFRAGEPAFYTDFMLDSQPFTRIPCWATSLLHGFSAGQLAFYTDSVLGSRPFTQILWTCWAADLLHRFHAGQLTFYTDSVLVHSCLQNLIMYVKIHV